MSPTAVGYPPTALGYPPSAISHPSSAISYPPTAVGCAPTAVGCTPAAIGYPLSAISWSCADFADHRTHQLFFFFELKHPLIFACRFNTTGGEQPPCPHFAIHSPQTVSPPRALSLWRPLPAMKSRYPGNTDGSDIDCIPMTTQPQDDTRSTN